MLIGLTGNFGTGKSTVLSLFERQGAVTVNSDRVVSGLYEKPEVMKAVEALLGNVSGPDGKTDKKKIAEIIFGEPILKKQLENLLHGRVIEEVKRVAGDHPGKIVIAEIPLLFEGGYEKTVDAVILTGCSRDTASRRLREKGYTDEEIARRLKNQMPDSEKAGKADFIIGTEGSIDQVNEQVKAVYALLLKKL